MGRWLKLEAHFDDEQAAFFCLGLKNLGIRNIPALSCLREEEQQELARELQMNRWVSPFLWCAWN